MANRCRFRRYYRIPHACRANRSHLESTNSEQEESRYHHRILAVLAFTLIRLLPQVNRRYWVHVQDCLRLQKVELTFSIAAATLMCLKPLVHEFNTSFGLGGDMVRTHGVTGYIASNGGTTPGTAKGTASRKARLRSYGASSQLYGKGSVLEMDSRDLTTDGKDNYVLVTQRSTHDLSETDLRPHLNSETTTTVSSDYRSRQHDSKGGTG